MERRPGFWEILWITAFLLSEGGLFVTLLVREAGGGSENALRFITVAVALFFAAELLFFRRTKERWFLLAAMLFTAAADVFLVLLDRQYELAVGLFFIAQCCHGARLLSAGNRRVPFAVLLRIGLTGVLLGGLWIFRFFAPLTALGALYAAELLANFTESVLLVRKEKRFLLSAAGFFLFILCDVTVAANGVGRGLGIPADAVRAMAGLTWIFYLPSQVLIVLSAFGERKAETEV